MISFKEGLIWALPMGCIWCVIRNRLISRVWMSVVRRMITVVGYPFALNLWAPS
jgi:hypothetical protein